MPFINYSLEILYTTLPRLLENKVKKKILLAFKNFVLSTKQFEAQLT